MSSTFTILDGGMGRELIRAGAPFRQPEWSALALMLAPETVEQAHRRFAEAGAEIVTTNSYALVPFHIGAAKFEAEGRALADLAGRLARNAANGAPQKVQVAGSAAAAVWLLPPRPVRCQACTGDHRAADRRPVTPCRPVVGRDHKLPGRSRIRTEAVAKDARPFWISFTLDDAGDDLAHPTCAPAKACRRW